MFSFSILEFIYLEEKAFPFQEEITRVLGRLQRCYESICSEVSTVQLHADEIEDHLGQNPDMSESKRKQLIQQSSIIGRMFSADSIHGIYMPQIIFLGHLVSANLLSNDPSVCIFELGAGKVNASFFFLFHFLFFS